LGLQTKKEKEQMKQKKLKDGRVIVDERCSCGHLQSEHGPDQYASKLGVIVEGHGGCLQLECNCQQYRWVGWVFEDGKEGTV
jgi:hypothetical protein